jgi:hypothetical protein
MSWPLSSSYVFSEFDFGSELTIVVLLCLLRVWFWFRVDHCHSEETQENDNGQLWTKIKLWVNIRGQQCSTLNQNQTLSKHKRELTIVVLLCLLRVWFWFRVDHCRPLMFSQSLIWFRVDHCRPLMFSQSLILVQSWPLSSSYVFSEVNIRGRQWSTLNQNQTLRKHKRTTMVNSEPKLNSE